MENLQYCSCRLDGKNRGEAPAGRKAREGLQSSLREEHGRGPARDGGRRVLFYAGDDAAAKAEIGALIERLGFFGVDMGDIETGSRTFQSPGGPLIAHNFVKTG